MSHNLPLGTTPGGKDWCLKALHPSDPLTEVRGIPDESCVPTVFMNYQTVAVVNAPTGSADSWGFQMAVTPNPVNFATVSAQDASGAHTASTSILNSQLQGATHALKYTDFKSYAQRWRLAYMSVTVYQDAPALSDQGTVVASQYAVAPTIIHRVMMSAASCIAFPRVAVYALEDVPTYNTSQSMPNAYFARSKEGCYMPLKLTRTCQRWRSAADDASACFAAPAVPDGWVSLPTTAGAAASPWPFIGATGAWQDNGLSSGGGTALPDMCSDVFGSVCARNLSLTTSYSFFFRCGYELQVIPGTPLSPQQKLSPPADPMAISNYFAVSRELKDAYPAEYNDLGKIWDVISAAASHVLPFLPGPIRLIGEGIKTVGDSIRSATKPKEVEQAAVGGQESLASAAQVERAREAVRAAPVSGKIVQAMKAKKNGRLSRR